MRIWKSRWVRRIVLGVVLTVIGRTAWLVGEREWRRVRGERAFAAAAAQVEATDPNWRWGDLNTKRRQVPGDRNSAAVIPAIRAATPPNWDRLWDGPDADRQPPLLPNARLPARDRDAASRVLAAAPEAVRLSRGLKDFPSGRRDYDLAPNVIDTLLPDAQHTREVARTLKWDAWVAADDGDAPRAADALAAALNASRSVGDEPFLIAQLVRLATRATMVRTLERVLAQTARPDHLAALRLPALQQALSEDAAEPLALYGIKGERATFDALAQRLSDRAIDIRSIGGTDGDDGFPVQAGWWLYCGRLAEDRAFCLNWLTSAAAAAALPVHEQPAAFDALPPVVQDENRVLLKLLPAVDKVAAAYWRNVAEVNCAVAAVACERFRLKHARWPGALAELCPEFLPAVPIDPFSGQPIRYTKCPDGVVTHSCGPESPTRRPPMTHPGLPDDIRIGFRLWNPDARRLDPPPEATP
jgi:hypothetical protein